MKLVSEDRPSLEYKTHEEELFQGRASEKYTRIVPYIKGDRILEIGAAEGVLSLLLASQGKSVIALEQNIHRHQKALTLQDTWKKLEKPVDTCHMVHGNILDRLDLLQQVDTVVSVRCIFYFKETIFDVFRAIGESVTNVTLCGNIKRARRFELSRGYFLQGKSLYYMQKMGLANILGRGLDPNLGFYERYASEAGMVELLENNQYHIVDRCVDGDPIVCGQKKNSF